MELWEMEERRQELGYTYKELADRVGITEEEVEDILNERIRWLRYETAFKLIAVLKADREPMCVRESVAYLDNMKKQQGSYRAEDYYELPGRCWAELIDGVIYQRTSPLLEHQLILLELAFAFRTYIKRKRGKCLVIIAPFDTRLDSDDKTVVKPDLIVQCNREKLSSEELNGAPDFIIEVLSPSTRKTDMTIKLRKYKESGVREYWMVDPKNEKVIVHRFEKQMEAIIYGFGEEVPVGIFDDELKLNIRQMLKELEL